MWGRGYESFFICALRHLKSTQKCRVPAFFQTKTTALHHGDWLGQIAPASSISLRKAHTSSNRGGGIRWNCSLKGSLFSMRIPIHCSPMQTHHDRPGLALLPLLHSLVTSGPTHPSSIFPAAFPVSLPLTWVQVGIPCLEQLPSPVTT